MNIEEINSILRREAEAIQNIPITDAYEKAINLIVEQVNVKKGKLVTSGMGKAGQIAQNIATDSLLAEPEKLADEHLCEMEAQQNEMFFKLYLVDALQTQSLNAEVASASFESEENVHDEDYVSGDQEVY